MSKNIKYILGLGIVIVVLIFGFISFMGNKIEYVDFKQAQMTTKLVEVKGVWVKEKESKFENNVFSFFMKDDNGTEMKVLYDGAKPNSFEVADALVVKGTVKEGNFKAKEILTKCPSKYEAKDKQQ
jgi:cytochrome c-type biogenesis protein CcmE